MPRKKKTDEEVKPEAEEEKVEETKTENKEEFPQTNISIDIFAPQTSSSEDVESGGKKSDKEGEKVEEIEIKEKVEDEKENVKESDEDKKKKKTRKELEKKAKELEKKIKTEDVKEKLKKLSEKEKTLVPIEDYVKYGSHIGTKVITPHMRQFVYRRRADSIAIINTNVIDKGLKEAIEFLSKYSPEDVIVVCKREAGWRAVELFSKITGVRAFTKKYPAGIITNSRLPNFFETELVLVCDPWVDKNAMNDAKKTKKKVIALCDTNNYAFNVDCIVPCNNKSNKSLGLMFYILAREYAKVKGIDIKIPEADDFVGEKVESNV